MRGYVQQQSSNTLYFDVKYGSICETSKKERDGFETIKVIDVSTGEELTKHIRRYDTIEALITKIEWRDTRQQYATRFQSWEIHLLNSQNEPAVLRLPLKSSASDRFMKCAENIDFARPVEFRAWKDTRGEREKTAFYIGQRVNESDEKSVKVDQKYKQGDMGECPEGVEELDGWNFAAQRKFLYTQMINVVIPKVEAVNAMRRQESPPNDEVDEYPF
jgi:hypothetical protein